MFNTLNKQIDKKLKYLSLKLDSRFFVYFRLISMMLLFILILFFVKYGFIFAPIVAVMYYILSEYLILDLSIKKRTEELEKNALEFFPVLLIGLGSGRNVKNAIDLAVSIVKNDLSDEFQKVLNDVQIGKSLDEALGLLKDRMPSIIINNMIISVMEANRLGNNIEESVNIQLGYIRDKRKRSVLSKNKLVPLEIAVISIIFVFLMLLSLLLFTIYL